MISIPNTQFWAGVALTLVIFSVSFLDIPPEFRTWGFKVSIVLTTLAILKTVLTYFGEQKQLTPSTRIYREFLKHMHQEGRKLQREVFPYNSKWARLWRRFMPYKPIPDKKLMEIKNQYMKWRLSLFNAVKFVFKKPDGPGALPAFILFGNGYLDPKTDWGRQLKMDLQAVEVLHQIKSVGFSRNFDKYPEKLNEFKEY